MEERIQIVNAIIEEIASRGRKFFSHSGTVAFMFYHDGKLFMKNPWNDLDMEFYPNYERPEHWSNGGTLLGLAKDFRDFIVTGEFSNHNNGYGGLFCPHWGYSPEDMAEIRQKAFELGYLESVNFY